MVPPGTDVVPPTPSSARAARIVLVVVLMLLAPFVAEYLAFGSVDRLGLIVFLAPMYGSGAVLIREAARRTTRPALTIALLATAYGIAEAGLIDMSLFNPSYEDSGEDFTRAAHLPVLETGAYSLLSFVGGHVVWSIGVPIGLTEALAPVRLRRVPWVSRVGLALLGLLYVGGAILIHSDVAKDFTPSAVQTIVAVVVLVACLVSAWLLRHRPARPAGAVGVPAWGVGLVAFALASAWCALPENWLGVAGQLVVLALTLAAASWAFGRVRWGGGHTFAVAAGALLTYLWVAYVYPIADYPGDQANPATERLSEAVFTVFCLGLVALGVGRQRQAAR